MSQETYVQQAAVRWFRYEYPDLAKLLVHIPNEGKRTMKWIKGRLVCTGGIRAKDEGVVKGVADLILFVPSGEYHGLCLETKKEDISYKGGKMKKTRTYQSPEQKEWQSLVEKQGFKYVVYRNIEEFIAIVKDYFKK